MGARGVSFKPEAGAVHAGDELATHRGPPEVGGSAIALSEARGRGEQRHRHHAEEQQGPDAPGALRYG